MKALASHSHHWTRRLAPVALVLVLLALPLLVYVVFANTVVNWTAAIAQTGTNAPLQESSATLNDRIEQASSVTGGKASSRLELSGGNHSSPIAATAPFTYRISPPSPDGSNGWYRGPVVVTWLWDPAQPAGTPPPCPPESVPDQLPKSSMCTVGTTTVTTPPIKRDGTPPNPPSVTATAGGAPYTSGTWTNKDVVVTVASNGDNMSGVASCTKGDSYTYDIVTTIRANCTDNAGNISGLSDPFTVKVDKTGPVGRATLNPPANSYGWNKPPTNLTWTWTDAGVGTIDTTRCTTSSSVTVEGINTYPTATQTVICYDTLGNAGAPVPYTVKLDRTLPYWGTTSATSNGSPYSLGTWTKFPVAVNFTCKDDVSGPVGAADGIKSTTVTVNVAQEGVNMSATAAASQCVDKAGNQAQTGATYGDSTRGISIDMTKPVITWSLSPKPNVYGWNNTDVTVNFTCADVGNVQSGIAVNTVAPVTISKEGQNLQVTSTGSCVDAAGNVADPVTVSGINIDKTPPYYGLPNTGTTMMAASVSAGITAFSNGKPYAAGTWTNAPVDVLFQCSDNLSGPVIDPVKKPISQEGDNLIATASAAECKDYAGNLGTQDRSFGPIKIDMTPPNPPIPLVDPPPNNNGWNNTDVTVSFQGNGDGGKAPSGVASCGPTQVLTNETAGTAVAGTCTDVAGNQSSSASVTVKIDKTMPVLTGSRTPGPNQNGWNNTSVTVGFTCAETGPVQSGIAANNVAGGVISTEGKGQSLTNTGSCTDKAGNTAVPASVSGINIDWTKPNAPTPLVNPPPNGNGWNNTNVTVSFSHNGDGGIAPSGVVSCTPPTALTSETPGTVVTGTCTDAADNVSDPGAVTVKIDKSAPVITLLTPPGGYLVGCLAKPQYTFNADISGVYRNSVDGPTLAVASDGTIVNRYTITVQDLAGNTATKTVDYLAYKTDGPFWQSPIDPNTVSLFNLGSVIPIKFQLLDCNNKPVTSADARLRVDFLGSAPPQNIDPVTKVGGPDSGNKFRVTGDSYQFNWSTKGLWVGNYKITVMIGSIPIRSTTIGLR